jgi:hypothetical protein
VRGQLYECERVHIPIEGDNPGHQLRPIVLPRIRALWVPDAKLLFQWVGLDGKVQVSECEAFPPSSENGRVRFIEYRTVPYSAIQEARKYLERQRKRQALQASIQTAMDRLTGQMIRSEGRLQSIAGSLLRG